MRHNSPAKAEIVCHICEDIESEKALLVHSPCRSIGMGKATSTKPVRKCSGLSIVQVQGEQPLLCFGEMTFDSSDIVGREEAE